MKMNIDHIESLIADLEMVAQRITTYGEDEAHIVTVIPCIDKRQAIQLLLDASTTIETLMKERRQYLEKIDSNDCAKAVALYKKSPSEFEKFVDDGTMKLARELCRHSCAGAEPLLGYCIGCEYDRKTVNIISGGIKTKTPPDKIRERLRVSYG